MSDRTHVVMLHFDVRPQPSAAMGHSARGRFVLCDGTWVHCDFLPDARHVGLIGRLVMFGGGTGAFCPYEDQSLRMVAVSAVYAEPVRAFFDVLYDTIPGFIGVTSFQLHGGGEIGAIDATRHEHLGRMGSLLLFRSGAQEFSPYSDATLQRWPEHDDLVAGLWAWRTGAGDLLLHPAGSAPQITAVPKRKRYP